MNFSIVVPTHSRPEMLRKLLASVDTLDYPKDQFELILIGDPRDSGKKIADEYIASTEVSARYDTIPDDPWDGRNPSAKRNHGVSLAKYDWIAFTDDDCMIKSTWLKAAAATLQEHPETGAIEGQVRIPPVDPPTLTYKGLKQLEKPEGYQTCNMFYNKAVFENIGGFDLNFPFYLEDTDLAWSVIAKKGPIPLSKDAVVEHPVAPPQPKRILANAKRLILVPYLYKKHPEQFQKSNMNPMGRYSKFYLPPLFLFVYGLVTLRIDVSLVAVALILCMSFVQNLMRFRGVKWEWSELLQCTWYSALFPAVAYVQFIRGLMRHKTKLLLF